MTHADRRLAAILSADVAGYSRLMGEDEPGTIAALAECFTLFRRHLEEHNGRLVDTAGDSFLAVFESVTDAVLCAMAAQKSLAEWNDPRPAARRMVLRVGVNLGDIFLQADGHVYGDGVNVAARLQTFAEPGGICVSEMVRAAVGNKLPAVFDSLGEQKFKNIAVPMSVYEARLIPDAALPDPPTRSARRDADEPTTIVFASALSKRLMDQVRAVAATAATVLIQGESGVGKELLARRIHEESPRRGGPFVKVDCASIPRALFEGELFGHVSGAVPGAMRDRTGHIEQAEGGTLFLDEVGDIPSELQVKLLRPLQDSTFERVGDGRTRRADVRFIAATNRDLTAQVSQGLLRRDLYFRLSVFPIKVPPLRARLEDIPVLARHFLAAHRSPGHRSAEDLTDAHVHHLQTYDWPGNVRELKNVVERALILSGDGPLRFDEALPKSSFSYPARTSASEEQAPARGFLTATEIEQLERNNLVGAMEATGWRISGTDGAAAQLGMPAPKLKARLKALRVDKPDPSSLYARLGGSRGIATFTRELFGRAVSHPQLGRFWEGRSTYGMLREERLLTAYLASAAGGPTRYIGRDMAAAHRDLGIGARDWAIFRGILADTLEALRVTEQERREVVAFAESLKADIIHEAPVAR
jgi:DNA-binding NtrC family response regulator/truncated hemoglobin YjbI